MKNSLLVFTLCLLCFPLQAEDIAQLNSHIPKWTTTHNADGSTRFEIVHLDKTHFYEIKLAGIDIDGEPITLDKPRMHYKNNLVIKKWLPYLTETWIDVQGQLKWSYEVNRPVFLPESAKQITLKYDVETDGQGGLTVSDQTTILLDMDVRGNTIHHTNESELHSVSLLGSRCIHAMDTAGYAGKSKTVVFDLNKQQFPLFTQGHISTNSYTMYEMNVRDPDWYLAQFSENSEFIQLVVPKETWRNGKQIDTYNIFHLKKASLEKIGFNLENNAQRLMEQVTENDLFDYFRLGALWSPIVADDFNRLKWQSDKKAGINHLKEMQSGLTGFGNLSFDIAFAKNIFVNGEYLYVITDGYGVSQISRLKNEQGQWIKQEPIVYQKQNTASNYQFLEEVIVNNDLMFVAMNVQEYVASSDSEVSQSDGEVRVYRDTNSQWQLEKILVPEMGHSGDQFGEVVAVGNDVVVSAAGFKKENPDDLNGLVHVFNYHAGNWLKPTVITPPSHAKNDGYFNSQGFGSDIQLVENDLYIKAAEQGYSSNNEKHSSTSVACPYFDSLGVIYHYRKVENEWRLLHELKSKDLSSHLVGPMIANDSGLYFMSSDSRINSEPEIFIKHYSEGEINWQQRLSN